MEYLKIIGGKKLCGTVDVHGAKNSVLPILAASVLISGECVIHNCPELSDVKHTVEILKTLGAKTKREGKTLIIDCSEISACEISEELMKEMRSSIVFLGALLSRCKEAKLFLPGGCDIGLRPVDMHLKALSQLGYDVSFDSRNICCKNDGAKPKRIVLPFPSVGATENIILSSVFLEGRTTIVNAAREPEIDDLCIFLNSAGAKISGFSTPVIEIEGVKRLSSVEHTVIPDRILASTLMCIAGATGSELRINRINPLHLAPVFPVFDEAGNELYIEKSSLFIKPPKRLKRVKKIETQPYPGFPTDCQAPLMAMLSLAKGASIINETIFENRFKHVPQLMRFGTDIEVKDRTAVINGVKRLHCAKAKSTDLRGGAALVVAALAAEGESIITDIEHIDRGYENIEELLSFAGASIERLNDEKEGNQKEENIINRRKRD